MFDRVKALETLRYQVTLPIYEHNSDAYWDAFTEGEVNMFDPQEVFPCFYWTYSSAFDQMAIEVLECIRDRGDWTTQPLSHEMFREVLCRMDFCDYGSSPRGCFWRLEPELLDALIAKFKEHLDVFWGET